MICRYVTSSNLREVCYDNATATLDITFHSGSTYRYSGVPQAVHVGLMQAPSHGEYFAQHIKDKYPYRKL